MKTDREILRELAYAYAQAADLPMQKATARNWAQLNSLKPARPTIIIEQIPWHEMNVNDELTCLCRDPFNRTMESSLRTMLYKWRHFKCDMVIPPFFMLPKVVHDSGIGVNSVIADETGREGAQTHLYTDQLPNEAAVDSLHNHIITYDKAETEKNVGLAEEMFGDILPVKACGSLLWLALWDRIVFWRGAENVLYSLIDEPELLHKLMKKLVDIEMDLIDQMEAQNLLYAGPGAVCHCMETYLDEPYQPDFDPEHIRACDCWVSGAAQIFSEVSPAMHDEFEIEYMKPVYERFGWVNYGCCEPLHNKIDIIRKIKNVRAISTSPWSDVNKAAEAMHGDFLMARKPNPSYVASGYVSIDAVRDEIRATLRACRDNNTNVEFILKDITTVNSRPECLTEWYELVKSEIENF